MAPTLILLDGFEYGLSPFVSTSSNGAGICTSVGNPANISCDSTVKRSGGYSLKVIQDGVNATSIVKTFASTTMLVGAFYYRAAAAPSGDSQIFKTASGAARFGIKSTGVMYADLGGAQTVTAGSLVDSAWHLIDFRVNVVANPQLLDWSVDGAAQTQVSRAVAASTLTTVTVGGTATNDHTFWCDDLVLSVTSGDYPIGSTTVPHSVLSVLPSGDGTHNAGTNTIEDNAGTDIASPNAFPILNNWPPDTAAYIRQATVDTTAYAEVTFANHDAGIGTIWAASPLLAYTSSTNAANEGACIVSYDAFTTPLEVYGTASARTNYQTSATTAPFYKTKNGTTADGLITAPGGGWTTTAFDALTARVGHSNDVTGNPRWLGVLIQYAGTAAGLSTGDTQYAGMVPV